MPPASLEELEARVVACRTCPELRAYCAQIGRVKKRAFREHEYWAKPVPGFGAADARVVLVGLAPGAHGSNRTGRVFTGDGSGEWLYRALHRAGFASRPDAIDRHDGMTLHDCFITAAVRCAPPANKPTPAQRARCLPYLRHEFGLLAQTRVIVTLGKLADDTVHGLVREHGAYHTPRAPFAHLAETTVTLGALRDVVILASYHPSRQNTNTGVLTEPMLDAVFARAAALRMREAPEPSAIHAPARRVWSYGGRRVKRTPRRTPIGATCIPLAGSRRAVRDTRFRQQA